MQNRKRDTDLQNSLLDSVGEGESGMFQENSIETCILSRVKQITGPGWMHETSARTWCSGRTWRERVGREVGGGIGMGKTCESKAFSFQCMTKLTTNKKSKKETKAAKKKKNVKTYCLRAKNWSFILNIVTFNTLSINCPYYGEFHSF